MTNNHQLQCPDSPWVKNALTFITNHTNVPNYSDHIAVVRFLLNGHCGINNRTSIRNILNHLNNPNLNRESFQQRILVELKRAGVVATLVYPGPRGGVFIPCNENEVKQVVRQVLDRVNQEIQNLLGILLGTQMETLIGDFQTDIKRVVDNLP